MESVSTAASSHKGCFVQRLALIRIRFSSLPKASCLLVPEGNFHRHVWSSRKPTLCVHHCSLKRRLPERVRVWPDFGFFVPSASIDLMLAIGCFPVNRCQMVPSEFSCRPRSFPTCHCRTQSRRSVLCCRRHERLGWQVFFADISMALPTVLPK